MQSSLGSHGEGDIDEMKRMLLETSPYLLGLTVAVSALHSLFEILAFKSGTTQYT